MILRELSLPSRQPTMMMTNTYMTRKKNSHKRNSGNSQQTIQQLQASSHFFIQ